MDTLNKVHESRLYKIFLPLVSPLTDPAVKRIMASSTYQVSQHLSLRPLQRILCQCAVSGYRVPVQGCRAEGAGSVKICSSMSCACVVAVYGACDPETVPGGRTGLMV